MAQLLAFSRSPRAPRVTSYDLALVQSWIAQGALPTVANDGSFLRGWTVFVDEDGSICLMAPIPEPPFAIMPNGSGYDVLICDPDDPDELGLFHTLRDAVRGIAHWLAIPRIAV